MSSIRLPDTIILEVVLQSNVSTLKNLRLVCRSFHALIKIYGYSIKSCLLPRLYSQDMIQHFALASHNDDPIKAVFDIDRRILLARWISAIALKDEYVWPPSRAEQFEGCRSQIPLGDMWEYVAIGLGIMWRISEIARDLVEAEFGPSQPQVYLSTITCGYPKAAELEQKILQSQTEYLRSLSEIGRRSINFAIEYCVDVLYFLRAFEFDAFGDEIRQDTVDCGRPQVENWYKWVILREGPDFIASAWKSTKGNKRCTELLATERTRRPRNQFLAEQAAAESICDVLHERKLQHQFHYSGPPLGSPMLVEGGTSHDAVTYWMKRNGQMRIFRGRKSLSLGKPFGQRLTIDGVEVRVVEPWSYVCRVFKSLFKKT